MPLELAETIEAPSRSKNKKKATETNQEDQFKKQEDFSKLSDDLQAQIADWQKQNWYVAKLKGGWYGEKTFDENSGPEIVDKVQSLPVFFRLLGIRENKYQSELPQSENEAEVQSTKADDEENALAVFESCMVTLTEEDIRDRTNEWMHNLNVKDEKSASFAAYKDNHKSEMKSLDGVLQRLRYAISNKWEWRDVECLEDFNWHKGTVDIYRTDTGEKVRTREMNKAELNQRQKELFEIDEETSSSEETEA